MELSRVEIERACQIAEIETQKRLERFRPKKAAKDSSGWICEHSFHGSVGNELVCGMLIRWILASRRYEQCHYEQCYVEIHVKLQCLHKSAERVLRLVGFHQAGEGHQCCGDGYSDRQVVLARHTKRRYPLG